MEIRFTSTFEGESGQVEKILLKSYASLMESDPIFRVSGVENFRQTETYILENPDTVGRYCFFSWYKDDVIGFFSYDPRPAPYRCIVGHNCIVPEHRRRGFGKLQISEIFRQCINKGVENVDVTTCDHPFYVSAQRMYLSCGFCEVDRDQWDENQRCNLINYRKKLKES